LQGILDALENVVFHPLTFEKGGANGGGNNGGGNQGNQNLPPPAAPALNAPTPGAGSGT
jgi:hypothetical protein